MKYNLNLKIRILCTERLTEISKSFLDFNYSLCLISQLWLTTSLNMFNYPFSSPDCPLDGQVLASRSYWKSRFFHSPNKPIQNSFISWIPCTIPNWVPKNWRFQTVVLEKTLESPLDSKEIKPVNPKGNQS